MLRGVPACMTMAAPPSHTARGDVRARIASSIGIPVFALLAEALSATRQAAGWIIRNVNLAALLAAAPASN